MNYPVGGEIAVRLIGEPGAHCYDEVEVEGKLCVVLERGESSFRAVALDRDLIKDYAESDRLDRLQSYYTAAVDPAKAFEVIGTATFPL